MKFYKKKEDHEILPQIQHVINQRPTYGYKRITAMINRTRAQKGEERLNKKRVYRLMKMNHLMLPKSGTVVREQSGNGKVMTLYPNTRWCSDAFEIRCWNDERVHIAFSLDCCDREAMSYVASKNHIESRDIQELMLSTVENRFGNPRASRMIEWLTDRGAVYRASSVQTLAKKLGLKPCFTAAYSPQSNGMAEAFVKSFKRDYVYTNDCVSANWVIQRLPEWFRDYNELAPHSALDMKSPFEYKKGLTKCVN